MKKIFYSAILILVTVITCCSIYTILNIEGNNCYEMSKNIESGIENNNEITKNTTNNEIKQNKEVNNGEFKNDYVKDTVDSIIESRDVVLEKEHKVAIMEESIENISEEEKMKYKSVFKVDSKNIVDNLSIIDKLKLLRIANKLSKENYKKLDSYLKNKNCEIGIREAYKLLKSNLKDSDMENIKDILGNYIDVEIVEKTQ